MSKKHRYDDAFREKVLAAVSAARASGQAVRPVLKRLGVSYGTFYQWARAHKRDTQNITFVENGSEPIPKNDAVGDFLTQILAVRAQLTALAAALTKAGFR